MPHTAKSWLQILLLCTMAGASVAVEPSTFMVALSWGLVVGYAFLYHRERERHARTQMRERELLDRHVTKTRHNFPEMILN